MSTRPPPHPGGMLLPSDILFPRGGCGEPGATSLRSGMSFLKINRAQ